MGGLGVNVQHFPLTLLVVLTTLTLPCECDCPKNIFFRILGGGARVSYAYVRHAFQTTSAVITYSSLNVRQSHCATVGVVQLLETELSLSPVLDCGTVCRQTLSRVTLSRGSGENLKHFSSHNHIPPF